ncbi:MAG: IPT/TIG domain-containing protein [Pseudomonadota bacterium]|nr:IPT/TIG domain-containing protein [Pseudomonadota bacterium]
MFIMPGGEPGRRAIPKDQPSEPSMRIPVRVSAWLLAAFLAGMGLSPNAHAQSAGCNVINATWGAGVSLSNGGELWHPSLSVLAGEQLTYTVTTSGAVNPSSTGFAIYKNGGAGPGDVLLEEYAHPGSELNLNATLTIPEDDTEFVLYAWTDLLPTASLQATVTCAPAPTPVPVITGVAPSTGSTAGGTVVVITGTNLAGATAVSFGGTPATSFIVGSGTLITAVAPAHAAGTVNIAVTTASGTGTAAGAYTYQMPPPTISGVSPASGGLAGGTVVTITGTNLGLATAVTFGGTAATSFSYDPMSGGLLAIAPAHAAGPVDVVVTTPGGMATAADGYTYASPLPLLSITDASSGEGSSLVFTVMLSAPAGPGGVSFDLSTADVTATSGTDYFAISATGRFIPQGQTTYLHVVAVINDLDDEADETLFLNVTNVVGATLVDAQGLGTIIDDDAPAPTITSVAPASGTTLGGSLVTITGTNLSGATAVSFDGAPVPGYTVDSATQITVMTPVHAAGQVDVAVTTAGGTATSVGAYTFVAPAPTITSVAPASGTTLGGSLVTITGTNLSGATAVSFDGAPVPGYTVDSATQITVMTPVHAAGQVDVAVTTAGGTATSVGAYTFVAPAPTITSVAPVSGWTLGGASVVITGTNLTGATAISFGGTAAPSYTVDSDTQITAITPVHAAEAVDVAVTTASGTGIASLAYIYLQPPPTITGVAPATGSALGGTSIVITGTNLTGASLVSMDGVSAPSHTVDSDTQITAVTPPHAVGTVSVIVQTPGGIAIGIAAFTYGVPAPTIMAVANGTGPTTGGTAVLISGTNFVDVTSVAFEGTPAASFTVDSATQITAVSPAHAAGQADLSITTATGTVTVPDVFTYLVPGPMINNVAPAVGTTAGGTSVVITGINLTGVSDVSFGGVAAAGFTGDSDTQITATTPGHAEGAVIVTVSTPGGTAMLGGGYTFVQAPTITNVAPASGTTLGGASVVITGTDFTGASTVSFGGTAATGFTVDSDTQITATTPAHAAGVADVHVTTPGGTATATGAYTFVTPAPTITNVAPGSGTTLGGTSVVITGTNLTGATAVSFGGTAATSFTVDNDTQITATTPAHAAEAADVAVTTSGGTDTAAGAFTFVTPAPTITNVAPTSGTTLGGTSVVITGTNLTGATTVSFGGTAATSFTVDSDTQITATTPAHAAGAADVDVTTSGGTDIAAAAFTFVTPAPTITNVAPTTGTTLGGASVVITGTNLTDATAVSFGGTAAISYTVDSDTQITATTPAHAAGAADVGVTTPGGTATAAGAYTFVTPAPTITNVAPANGTTLGGTVVVLTGANFTGASAVSFGGTAATAFTVDSDTKITATTPIHAAGATDVAATTAGGTATAINAYTFVTPAPTITSVAPTTGTTLGGTRVVITGTNLTGATAVSFGGTAAISYTVDSDTQITAITPAHAAGAADVAATTPGGTATAAGAFTFVTPAPTITNVAPTSGTTLGGTSVVITGINLTGATAVSFGGTAATIFTVDSDTQITATTPAHGAGAVDVAVTTPGGAAMAAGAFSFQVPAPTITGLSPASGPTAGGTSIVITGSHFTGATVVTLGGTAATSHTVDSDTQVTAVVPAHAAGAVDVAVTTPGGTGTLAAAFEYIAPTFTFSPAAGAIPDGTAGLDYLQAIDVTGGTGSYAFTAIGLPEGMAVDPATGTLQGMPTTPGNYVVVVTVEDGGGLTGSVEYRWTIVGTYRPDPTQDPEVTGLVNAQAQSAERIVSAQLLNFNQRLERLHDDTSRDSHSISFSKPRAPDALMAWRDGDDDAWPTGGPSPFATERARNTNDASAQAEPRPTAAVARDTSFWTGGFVNFGSNDFASIGTDHTVIGVSGGVDHRFSTDFVAGVGLGYARDSTDIGNNGSENNGRAISGAVYASYHPAPFYIDGLLGVGRIDLDSRRHVTTTGGFADGSRDSRQLFGSLSAGYEYREDGILFSPYGRIDAATTELDAYVETGPGAYNLAVGKQDVEMLAGVVGLRAERAIAMEWGALMPRGRFEYTRDFAGSSQATLGYADLGTMPYTFELHGYMREYVTLGLGLDAVFGNNMRLSLDYRTAFDIDDDARNHIFGIRLSGRF